jgi:DNA-directed RNA polymerase subunit RPC12/RpoP
VKEEAVECYKCGGDVPLTSTKRPLLITCPQCGTKGMIED